MGEVTTAETPTRGRPRVLAVDDERGILDLYRRVFRKQYDVQLAESGAAALALIDQQTFDVALVDYSMPAMNGVTLIREATRRQPGLQCILVTAHTDLPEVQEARSGGLVATVVMKPWNADEVARWVDRCAGLAAMRSAVAVMKSEVKPPPGEKG